MLQSTFSVRSTSHARPNRFCSLATGAHNGHPYMQINENDTSHKVTPFPTNVNSIMSKFIIIYLVSNGKQPAPSIKSGCNLLTSLCHVWIDDGIRATIVCVCVCVGEPMRHRVCSSVHIICQVNYAVRSVFRNRNVASYCNVELVKLNNY